MIAAIIIELRAGYIACQLRDKKKKGLLTYLLLTILGCFARDRLFGLLGAESYGGLVQLVASVIGA